MRRWAPGRTGAGDADHLAAGGALGAASGVLVLEVVLLPARTADGDRHGFPPFEGWGNRLGIPFGA